MVGERSKRREQQLELLTTLFMSEGFLKFGMGDLAARLRCSRTTLYAVAPSKEQIVMAVVRNFFRRATTHIEACVAEDANPATRLTTYLAAVAEELASASAAFYADLASFPPANEIYERNTLSAAQRVCDLVSEGIAAGALRAADASFVGAAVAEVMKSIQDGRLRETTKLDDAAAYKALADLIINGLHA